MVGLAAVFWDHHPKLGKIFKNLSKTRWKTSQFLVNLVNEKRGWKEYLKITLDPLCFPSNVKKEGHSILKFAIGIQEGHNKNTTCSIFVVIRM